MHCLARNGFLAAFVFCLVGCVTTPPPIPPELQYAAPQNAAPVGTIVGSEEKSGWADNFTVFVIGVDGKRVMAGRGGWDTPLPLVQGLRKLVVEFNRGSFVANTSIELNVEAGADYQLQYSSDVQFMGRSRYCDFWVIDKRSKQSVTPIQRATVIRDAPQGGFVPVFIPKR